MSSSGCSRCRTPYPGNRVLAQFVIPAKAGIQIFLFCSTMDAHFRGHDNFLFKLSHYRKSCHIEISGTINREGVRPLTDLARLIFARNIPTLSRAGGCEKKGNPPWMLIICCFVAKSGEATVDWLCSHNNLLKPALRGRKRFFCFLRRLPLPR